MRYRFSLGRGEAAMVLGGATIVGALLFATGVMTGLAFARGRAAEPGAAMVAAPDAAAADSATIARAVADSAAAVQGAPAPPVQPAAFAAPRDGIGGPSPDDAVAVGADGWSVPAGYAPPAGSSSRWASLPPMSGPDAADPSSPSPDAPAGRYAAADPGSTAPRSRLAPAAAPEPANLPRPAPGEARFRAYDGGGGPYALQVGRFREEKAALKVVDELRARGHDVYVYTVAERGSPLFSVRMDRYGDRETAMRAAERLEQREQLAAVVVPTEPR